MKNTILRTLMGAILLSLVSVILISTIGLILGWKTTAQFSDGFFWAGFILLVIALMSYQGYTRPSYDWPLIRFAPAARANLYMVDTFDGNTITAFLGIAGLLLVGMSILILRVF